MRKICLSILLVCLSLTLKPIKVVCEDREISINSQLKEVINNNDLLAEATLKSISFANETYKSNIGKYPDSIEELLGEDQPYLPSGFDPKRTQGYQYSIETSPYSCKIIATPLDCGRTGSKIIILNSIGGIEVEDCQ